MTRDVLIVCAMLALFAGLGYWLLVRESAAPRVYVEDMPAAEPRPAPISSPLPPAPAREVSAPEAAAPEPVTAVAGWFSEQAEPAGKTEVVMTGVTVDEHGVRVPGVSLEAHVYFYAEGTTDAQIAEARAAHKVHWKRGFTVHGTSDHNGDFRITWLGEPGEHAFHRVEIIAAKDTGREASTGLIAEHEGLSIVVPAAASLSGRLVDEHGAPVPDVVVRLYTRHGWRNTMTPSSGEFLFASVPPGETRVFFEPLSHAIPPEQTVQLEPERLHELGDILLRSVTRGKLIVTLEGENWMTVMMAASLDFYAGTELVHSAGAWGRNEDGIMLLRCKLDGLKPGEYRLKVTPESTWTFLAEGYGPVELFVRVEELAENDFGTVMIPRTR